MTDERRSGKNLGELYGGPFDLEAFLLTQKINGYADNIRLNRSLWLPFEHLPHELTVGAIEPFSNQAFEEMQSDPDGEERAGVVRLNFDNLIFRRTPSLRFPKKYSVGATIRDDDNNIITQEVDLDLEVTRHSYPILTMHSHDKNSPFSPIDLDNRINHPFPTLVDIVTSSDFNYLLFRSQDSNPANEVFSKHLALLRAFSQDASPVISKLTTLNFAGAIDDAQVEHALDLVIWYFQTKYIQILAEDYKFGFYISQKDGKYTFVSDERLGQLMGEELAKIGIALDAILP